MTEDYVLLLKMHHIIYDGWSLNIFFSELSQLYEAFSQGLPNPLAELPIQYADFAVWQRKWLTGAVLDRQVNYWQQKLAGVPHVLELPSDRQRSPVQTFRGGVGRFQLDRDLTQRLKQLSQESDATLFITLLAAFLILISRYSGQLDLVVGSPIANRNNLEFERLMGFFVNTLVLRGDLSGNPTFADFHAQVRQTTLSAYAHQDLPFEMLVEKLQPVRDLSRNPLVQVVFALQNAPQSSSDLPGLTIESMPLPLDLTARFDLEVNCFEISGGLEGAWSYNSDLFDATTITRIAQHFENLLQAIVANPKARITELPLLSPAERDRLLVQWNDTSIEYPQDKCIHQLFEEQVERTPNAVAVVFEDQQLTYNQLNSCANQLAHYLQSLGVGANVLVGICVERSIEMVVGLLGILKAGGAYVPLDPAYPTQRLSDMLSDSGVEVLLTQQQHVESLPKHEAVVVCLDSDWHDIANHSQKNLITNTTSDNLVYTIYTSGSTGKPKGAGVYHRGFVNLVNWMIRDFQLTLEDSTVLISSVSFDLTQKNIFAPLLIGGKLHLVGEGFDPDYILEVIEKQRVTWVNCTPSTFYATLTSSDESFAKTQSLRYVFLGGEPISIASFLSWQNSEYCRALIVNSYGPTECADVCSAYVVDQSNEFLNKAIPIGKPIGNVKLYIVDQNLQIVPVGVIGELCIAGVGVGMGYINDTERTNEKFIPNPFSNGKSERLYKTGDLARYLADGNIEYIGRIDNQVKIRGFRIELGEIEAALNAHEQIELAVVIAREDIPGDRRLVAYVVASHKSITTKEVRELIRGKLPEYMVPNAIVILESLPLTPNGKIDRRALPAPTERTGIEVDLVAPRTPIEAKLVEIWAQVLRVNAVGIYDNFFSLGGDSILSIQIIAKARQAGIELTLKQLFANQTIAELATVATTTKVLKIQQGLVTGTLPLTPIQQWFFEEKFPQPHHYNQSFLLSVPSDIKLEILEQVWTELLTHHDVLRLRFTQTGSSWQAVFAAPGDRVGILYFDLSTVPENEQKNTIESTANELQASLNLSSNLVRVAFFWLGSHKKARLLMIIHHLVVDGVSWRILLEDLQIGYEQLIRGQAIQLPAKTTSFKDWAQKLTEYAQSEIFKSELVYWLSASKSGVSSIPVDYADGVNTVISNHTVSVSLNSTETNWLLQDVPQAYKTQINDVLLTALVLVLSRWTNSKAVLFNLEGHGREDIIDGVDISRTVGWFTTIFPVVLKLETIELDNLGNAIKSVKEQLRAIPNRGIGYGLLRYLNTEADITAQLASIPIPQISFNYLGQFTQVLNTSSLISLASESSGQFQSSQGERSSLLDINAIIANEQLQIHWTYSSNIHEHTTIENIAQEFVDMLARTYCSLFRARKYRLYANRFPIN